MQGTKRAKGRVAANGGWMDDFHYESIYRFAGTSKPRIALIPTAQFDDPSSLEETERSFLRAGPCTTVPVFTLGTRLRLAPIRRAVLGSDLVFALGGDTGTMMRTWRRTGLDDVLQAAYRKGIALAGMPDEQKYARQIT